MAVIAAEGEQERRPSQGGRSTIALDLSASAGLVRP
jgi:hypothetical protein